MDAVSSEADVPVGVSLRPMVGSEIAEFIDASRDGYLAERVAAGEDRAVAARATDEQVATLFPDGEPGPGHLLFRLEEHGRPVGSLWMGTSVDEPESFWIWDVIVDEPHRGRGFGRAVMLLAEREARSRGAAELGLSVFGHNTVARHLYESLGYDTVSLRMSKRLG